MEYSRLPNYIGRKENNPFSSKEDNWIIRVNMRRILIEKEYVNPRECSYGFPWDSDGTCYNFKSPNECVKSSEIDTIENLEDV